MKRDKLTKKTEGIQGIISINSRGIGYVPHKNREEDIEILNASLKTALNGDTVEIIFLPKIKGERSRGEVVKIIRREKRQFVGVLEKVGGSFFLIPDDKRMYRDILIVGGKSEELKNGTKALVKIVEWKNPLKNPIGEIVKIIGEKGLHEVEMISIILEKGFDVSFNPDVEKEARIIRDEEKKRFNEEVKKRRDFRGIPTFTIDPEDAKDFDDAISIHELQGSDLEIGVHIADVSHYVKEGSLLDKESRKRGFSLYLVDRTIPMLPEVLSNDLCSLNPNEDKLAFSVVTVMTKNGDAKSRWFGKTVIKSNKRFTYEAVQEILDNKAGAFHRELQTLNKIAKILRVKKFKEGAIDFEVEEVKFRLDTYGKPLSVYKKERLDAHKLVEEFMLQANREVAELIYKKHEKIKRGAFIYRIHDTPDKDKIADLKIFLRALGYNLEIKDGTASPKALGKILKQAEGKPEESLIKTAAIRSMAKAIYSTKNIGHFGLAFQYYTHFTSPIRRYPDLIVHRILERDLREEKIPDNEFAKYEKIAMDTSEKEKNAAEAERASIKYKQVEYMKDHIGEVFWGIISGVTEWGIYVEEIETKCEGMVKLRNMKDDYYILEEKNYAIVGQKTKKRYSIGGKVKFKVLGGDLDRKTLDYGLV